MIRFIIADIKKGKCILIEACNDVILDIIR